MLGGGSIKYHIEFFGIPGAGKSTLCKKMLDFNFLNKKSFYCFDGAIELSTKRCILNQDKTTWKIWIKYLMYVIGQKGFSPIYNYTRFRFNAYNRFIKKYVELEKLILNRELNMEEIEILKRYFFSLGSGFHLVKEYLSKDEILIIDEGFIQRSLSLFWRGKEINGKKQLETYFDIVPLPDLIIFINVDIDNAIEHMKNRKRGVHQLVEEKDCKYMNYTIDEAVSILSNKKVDIIEVNNNGTLENSIEKLKESIFNYFIS